LIREAVACLLCWEHAIDVALPDGIITAVNSVKTRAGRAASSPPGFCFRRAGSLRSSIRGKASVLICGFATPSPCLRRCSQCARSDWPPDGRVFDAALPTEVQIRHGPNRASAASPR
jgi:hypothetical protein